MPVNDRDLSALEYLAARLREDTPGAGRWDAHGTHTVFARELKGKHLRTALELVVGHACDATAKTPAAITRRFTPEAPKSEHAHPPKRDEVCDRHPAYHRENCGGCAADKRAADGADTPPRAWEPAASDAAALARAAYAQARAQLCTHGTPRTACRDCSTPAQPSAESAPTEESTP